MVQIGCWREGIHLWRCGAKCVTLQRGWEYFDWALCEVT